MRSRRGGVSWFTLLLIGLLAGGTMLTHRFGPYYWDYWQMKEITKSTARTWKMLVVLELTTLWLYADFGGVLKIISSKMVVMSIIPLNNY